MKRILPTIALTLVSVTSFGQLLDPCCESSPPWNICGSGSFGSGGPCSPGGPSCGTYYYRFSDGVGAIDENGIYQCFPVLGAGFGQEVWAHFDMGLYTPYGGGAVFQLRVAPSPVACGSLCTAGELLFSSNIHNCGGWNDTGLLTYNPPSMGNYCLIAVACGDDGWSCGGLIAIDDLYFQIHGDPAVEDWVLY